MKKIKITNQGLFLKGTDKRVYLVDEFFDENGNYSFPCSLTLNEKRMKEKGEEVYSITDKNNSKATIQNAIASFRFDDKGSCYGIVAHTQDKTYPHLIWLGLVRDKSTILVVKGNFKYSPLILLREIKEEKDDKGQTILTTNI